MKTIIKKIYDEHFGALLCTIICSGIACVCAAFITGSEACLNAGMLLEGGAIVLPFIVEPQI